MSSLIPRWLDWHRARARVRPDDMLRSFGAMAAPIDVRRLAETFLGVEVEDRDGLQHSGEVNSRADGWAQVLVRASDPEYRKRFTIAHELGHLILQGPGRSFRDHQSFSGGPEETAANNFAADLLLPRYLVAPLAGKLSTEALAGLFGVSPAAMNIRLERLARGL